ncbi:hypothetical protein BDW59DRAFT_161880 [Aspergillus cavernicola]|uniref:CST complex subunit Stn1 N-terminal domain-containing protein n=1 Tax=Aspergillus cavernicola TaxID=176166 RepID=A0ABR4IE80_9EURO
MAPNDARSSNSISNNNNNNNDDDDDDASPTPSEELSFYPAFCYKASPTHFVWVKMGAVDVRRLQRKVEFGDQGLFFHLNHPIRFVNLIGIVVARVDVPRRTILTLDDSSGAVVDVVVLKAETTTTTPSVAVAVAAQKQKQNAWDNDNDEGKAGRQEMHVTSTTHAPMDISPLQPGKLFQLKGTLSIFRSTVQVHLERFFFVPDTKAEMHFVEARCRFLVEVLSVPWFVGEGDIARLRVEADEEGTKVEEEQARVRRRGRRRVDREERDRKKIEEVWEKEEVMREKGARVAREVGGEYMREIGRRQGKWGV